MKKSLKALVCAAGIVLGVIMIIMGLCVLNTSHSTASGPYIGKSISFGADFYTEIYSVTKDVGLAINDAAKDVTGSINNAVDNICGAISCMIISIGLVDIAFFAYKLAGCEYFYELLDNMKAKKAAAAAAAATEATANADENAADEQ